MPRIYAAALVLALVAPAHADQPPKPPSPIFRFQTDEFCLNLHHFLYVLGRAEAKATDASREAVAAAPADSERRLASLTPEERQGWRDAVAFYAAGPSRKDAIFDAPLPAISPPVVPTGNRPTVRLKRQR
jgi:hypothetical protein